MSGVDAMVAHVVEGLSALADAEKAEQMQAYMKSEMPFYGVQKPQRVPIFRALKKGFVPRDRQDYEARVLALWALPRREDRYAALFYARSFKAHITLESLPLYERLIREGAWWDLVDEVIMKLLNPLTLAHRATLRPLMDAWLEDEDLWIRRAAILCQAKHKAKTDPEQLFAYCLARAAEKEFFIRKAIGWALRQYAYTNAKAVRAFLEQHKDDLSTLSYREASKHL